jgi:hypothetical protein
MKWRYAKGNEATKGTVQKEWLQNRKKKSEGYIINQCSIYDWWSLQWNSLPCFDGIQPIRTSSVLELLSFWVLSSVQHSKTGPVPVLS